MNMAGRSFEVIVDGAQCHVVRFVDSGNLGERIFTFEQFEHFVTRLVEPKKEDGFQLCLKEGKVCLNQGQYAHFYTCCHNVLVALRGSGQLKMTLKHHL